MGGVLIAAGATPRGPEPGRCWGSWATARSARTNWVPALRGHCVGSCSVPMASRKGVGHAARTGGVGLGRRREHLGVPWLPVHGTMHTAPVVHGPGQIYTRGDPRSFEICTSRTTHPPTWPTTQGHAAGVASSRGSTHGDAPAEPPSHPHTHPHPGPGVIAARARSEAPHSRAVNTPRSLQYPGPAQTANGLSIPNT